jgi:hypothetical protein
VFAHRELRAGCGRTTPCQRILSHPGSPDKSTAGLQRLYSISSWTRPMGGRALRSQSLRRSRNDWFERVQYPAVPIAEASTGCAGRAAPGRTRLPTTLIAGSEARTQRSAAPLDCGQARRGERTWICQELSRRRTVRESTNHYSPGLTHGSSTCRLLLFSAVRRSARSKDSASSLTTCPRCGGSDNRKP